MDASMDLWASQSPLPSWWNAALLPTTATPMVAANNYGSQGVLMANWNTMEGMSLPYYITGGVPGNIAATGISERVDVGMDYDSVLMDANTLAAMQPTGAAAPSNALRYIVYITIAAVVLIILYKIFFSKPSAPSVQYVQTAPSGDEE
jgi:hypothetical protein